MQRPSTEAAGRSAGLRRAFAALAAAWWAAAASACGESGVRSADTTIADVDDTGTASNGFLGGDVAGFDSVTADTAQDAAQDTASDAAAGDANDGDTSAGIDIVFDVDTDDPDIGPAPDVEKPDVVFTALEVVSTTPADDGVSDGTLGAFSITFNQELEHVTVQPYTVKVHGPGNPELTGTFAGSGKTLTWQSDAPLAPVSRIEVTVTALVTDTKGQSLALPYTFHFYTADYSGMAPYAALAARYAPTLDVALSGGSDAQSDLLRTPSQLGWDMAQTSVAAGSQPALASVAWTVVESRSHFFVHYQVYWPKRAATGGLPAFDNDVAGVTVVVARYPQEHPIGLQTWFKRLDDEQHWLWLGDDAALLPSGAKLSSYGVRAVIGSNSLFPVASDGLGCAGIQGCVARRAPILLKGGTHQACLRLDKGEATGIKTCYWDASLAASTKQIRYVPATKADEASSSEGKTGDQPPTFGYTLEPLLPTWYARRGLPTAYGGPLDLSFVYKPPAGRPAGQNAAMGSKLLGGAGSDAGRPLWAWRWKPASNESYYDLPRGTITMDPSWALWQRLGGSSGGVKDFDTATKVGFSVDYCFNPLLFLDQRDAATCKNSLPTP